MHNKNSSHHHYHDGVLCEHDHSHDSHAHEAITLHDAEGFAQMRLAGKLAAKTLDYITPYIKPGVTTDELNSLCHDFIIANKGIPAALGYHGFPKSVCTSVNHVVCHGIPGPKKLVDGDIINIDSAVILNGWYGDASRMYTAGKPGIRAAKLINVTHEAMMLGIEQVKPGATLGDVGHAIQNHAEKNGFSVVRDYCGHGVGRVFHEAPNVLHYGKPGTGIVLQEGMIFTIEPMINAGKWQVKTLDDDWTVVTRDRSLSAQFEHTIGVTKDGYEIFTLSDA